LWELDFYRLEVFLKKADFLEALKIQQNLSYTLGKNAEQKKTKRKIEDCLSEFFNIPNK